MARKYRKPYEFSRNETNITTTGIQKTSKDISLINGVFNYDIPNSKWVIKENTIEIIGNQNSTLTYSQNGKLVVNSNSSVTSKRNLRFQPGRSSIFSTILELPSPTNDSKRDFGVFNEENGLFFRLKSDGLYSVIRSNSIETEEKINVQFNIDYSVGVNYSIQFLIGAYSVYNFYITNPATGIKKLVHTVKNIFIENASLPIAYKSENITVDSQILVSSYDLSKEGGEKNFLTFNRISSDINGIVIAATETPVLLLKVNETFNGKINTRDIFLSRITTSCVDEALINVYFTRDSSIFTGSTLLNHGGQDNIKYAINGSIIYTPNGNLVPIYSTRMEKDTKNQMESPREDTDYILTAGDYILVTMKSDGQNRTTWGAIEWGEEI